MGAIERSFTQAPRLGPADPWQRPVQVDQGELFDKPRDWVLARASVSLDELERWRAGGWISFDARELTRLDEAQVCEVCFVRDVARSGLSEAQVGRLLSELPRPFAYNPTRTAYSFKFGWVELPAPPSDDERDAFIQKHMKDWIEDKASTGAHELLAALGRQMIGAAACSRVAEAGSLDDVAHETT